jgi:hypothetical protein
MPPSLQSLPNELKQQIATNLIIPNNDPDTSSSAVYPPNFNLLIDISSILALRLVSKDLRNNAASAFEEIISEVCIGCHESSIDRLTKMSEHPYFREHIRHLTISLNICSEGLLDHYGSPSQVQAQIQALAPSYKKFMHTERRMLTSGCFMLKLARSFKNLHSCTSIALNGSKWYPEASKARRPLLPFTSNNEECTQRSGPAILSAVVHAVILSGISVHDFNAGFDKWSSLPFEAFTPHYIDKDSLEKAFTNVTNLKLQVLPWETKGDESFLGLTQFINGIPSVQEVTLSLSNGGANYYWYEDEQRVFSFECFNEVLPAIYLPKLRNLSLLHFGTRSANLIKLLIKHKGSLRSLYLYRIGIIPGYELLADPSQKWPNFMRQLIGKLSLERLTIQDPWGKSNSPWLVPEYFTITNPIMEGDIDAQLQEAAKELERIMLDDSTT